MEQIKDYHVLKTIFRILCVSVNLCVYQVFINCESDLCISGNNILEQLKPYQQWLGYKK